MIVCQVPCDCLLGVSDRKEICLLAKDPGVSAASRCRNHIEEGTQRNGRVKQDVITVVCEMRKPQAVAPRTMELSKIAPKGPKAAVF